MGAHDADISNALRSHGAWKLRLKTGINSGNLEIPASDVTQDNLCEFGKWIDRAKQDPSIANLPEFTQVVDLHRKFHLHAGSIARLIERDDPAGATQKLTDGEFDTLSRTLGAALMELKNATK